MIKTIRKRRAIKKANELESLRRTYNYVKNSCKSCINCKEEYLGYGGINYKCKLKHPDIDIFIEAKDYQDRCCEHYEIRRCYGKVSQLNEK